MAARAVGNLALIATVALTTLLVVDAARAQRPPTKEWPARGMLIPLPAGGLVIVGPAARPPVKGDSVTLTAEQYQQLLDRLEKLQAQVDAQKPMRPRSCELEGKVEVRGRVSVVRVRATFKFTTSRPNTVVHLGCQKAHALEAKSDDGKAPLLTTGDDGLRLLAPAAADYTIRLELEVPLVARGPKGAELGFEMGLPGAPITALSFEPPANVRRYNLVSKTPRPTGNGTAGVDTETEQPEVERFLAGKGGAPLGPITSLGLSWDDPARKADTPRSAEADITVTVGPTEVVSEAKIRVRGSAAEWKFTAPANADVTVKQSAKAAGESGLELPPERAPNVLRPDPGQSVWRVVFREPVAADFLINVVARQPRAQAGDPGVRGPFPIGPFVVLKVPQQSGTIRVRSPANWRVSATLKGETTREVEEGTGDSVYRYRQAETATPPKDPPATLTLTPVPGTTQARVRHEFRLTESGWKLRSEIAVSPARTEIEHIDIEVPTSFRPAQAEPPEIVEELTSLRESGPDRLVYRARLTAPRRASFSFTLEGDYPTPAGPGSASLSLPRLLGTSERSAEIVAIAPSRFDLRGVVRTWENGRAGSWTIALTPDSIDGGPRIRATVDNPIAVADFTWRLAASAATVQTSADIDIDESRVRVLQRFRFHFDGYVPDRIHLRAPRPVLGLQLMGGTLEQVPDGWNVLLSATTAHDQEFKLTYSASTQTGESSIHPPLLITDAADVTQTLRLWSTRWGSLSATDLGDWSEEATDIVAGRAELPALILKARGSIAPPVISGRQATAQGAAGPNLDRVHVDVALNDMGGAYRCQFWIRDWRKEIQLQLPAKAQGIELLIQGKRLTFVADGDGNEGIRMNLRPPVGGTAVTIVEVRYRAAGMSLEAAQLKHGLVIGNVTWTVAAQPGSIVLIPGNVAGSWSAAAFLNVFGLTSNFPTVAEPAASGPAVGSGILIRGSTDDRIIVVQVPRTTWVLVCSAAGFVVFAGTMLLIHRRRKLVLAIGIVAFAVAVFWVPQPLAQATFAALPGVAVFLMMSLVYRWMRLRYRRRLSRVVGFARPGSSLVRPSASSANRPRDSSDQGSKAVPAPIPSSS